MSDSSPFVERPVRRPSASLSPLRTPRTPAFTTTETTLTTEINKLTLQLKDKATQLELTKLENEREIQELQKKLLEQQAKNDSITSDQIYLYSQNKELQSKLAHLNENNEIERNKSERLISTLRKDLSYYKEQNEELNSGSKYELAKVKQDQQNTNVELDRLNQTTDELSAQLHDKDAQLTLLKSQLSDKDNELDILNSKLRSIPSKDEIDAVSTIKTQLTEQVSYIKDLELKNLSQAEQIKKLVLNKQNVEVLREEKASLLKKLDKLDELNNTIDDLNLEILNLKQENSKWRIYLDDYNDQNIEDFMRNFKLLRDEQLLLRNNYDKLELELKVSKQKSNDLFISNQSLSTELDQLTNNLHNLTKINIELEQQKNLSFEESNFLREQLRNLDQELSLSENDRNNYIQNLEGLVDEYKRKIQELSKTPLELPNKRKRDEDENTTRNFQTSVSRLEEDIFKLNTEISRLSNENALLVKKIEANNQYKEKVRILQLRNNPFNKDQLIKQKQLESLQKENKELLDMKDDYASIPKSVYDSAQLEIQQLNNKLTDLNKRTQRLKQIYQSKSSEFMQSIKSLFGFKLEFLQSNKIKLVSKYIKNEENCLIVDPLNNTFKLLKVSEEDEEFFKVCESLIEFWIKQNNEIPCFLGALTLELFEKNRAS